MSARISLKLRAAMHETRCRECRVSWRSWWRRLRGDDGTYRTVTPVVEVHTHLAECCDACERANAPS